MEISNLSGLEKNMEAKGDSSSHIVRVFQEQVDASLTWEFVRWMRAVTKLPIFVKVLHPDNCPDQSTGCCVILQILAFPTLSPYSHYLYGCMVSAKLQACGA